MEGNDVHEMLQTTANAVRVPVTTGTKILVPRNDARRALIIGGNATIDVVLGMDPGLDNTNGIVIPANGPPLVLSVLQHGAAVWGPWYVTSSAGGGTITYVEVTSTCGCDTKIR